MTDDKLERFESLTMLCGEKKLNSIEESKRKSLKSEIESKLAQAEKIQINWNEELSEKIHNIVCSHCFGYYGGVDIAIEEIESELKELLQTQLTDSDKQELSQLRPIVERLKDNLETRKKWFTLLGEPEKKSTLTHYQAHEMVIGILESILFSSEAKQ